MGRSILMILPVVILAGFIAAFTTIRLQSVQAENATLSQKLKALEDNQQASGVVNDELRKRLETVTTDAAKAAAESATRIDSLESELAGLRRKAEQAGRGAVVAAAVEDDWGDKPEAAPAAGGKKGLKGFGAMLQNMMKDKDMKEMMRQSQRNMLGQMYGSLFKRLGLEGERLEQFKDLLLERQMAGAEKGMSLLGAGQDPEKMKQIAEDIRLEQEAADAEIAAMLSPEENERYKSYQQTLGERMMTSQFVASLQGTNDPLTEDQTERLIDLMHENNKAVMGDQFTSNDPAIAMQAMQSKEGMDAMLKKMEEANTTLLERSGTILNPTQQEAFVAHQAQQRKMQEMGMKMAKAMFQNKDENGGDTGDALIVPQFDIQVQPAQ